MQYYSSFHNLSKNKIVSYGYTYRRAGRFKKNSNILNFIRRFSPQAKVVLMEQIHSNHITTVENISQPLTIYPQTDGLFYPQAQNNIFLIIKTADCLPILIWDKKGNLGVAHAGWQGSLNNINGRLISFFLKQSSAKEVSIFFGPAIGPCCYYIYGSRLKAFQSHFFKWQKKFILRNQNQNTLDLKTLNFLQAQELQIPAANIKTIINCTSCQKNKFFSYHRDKVVRGNIISWIGIIKKKVSLTLG